ncbi:MAG: Sodium/glucose cotransporter [Verrucomicrobia subdivision 3 bacterium]|nr:Sodium/glucose cotransporter [Limisphaerales bacterium]MCS1414506.1 Sodium/glucose cotransporter [Limisphaerales bacterium]
MNSLAIIGAILAYFGALYGISRITGKEANEASYFRGNRASPWYVVAFGMIGASLSGVTFISVPGWVGTSAFSYLQMVLGYLIGYVVIAEVLIPLYYRHNLTSIYGYLGQRFGRCTYSTGAAFFLVSRVIGASFRLFLVALVFNLVFERLGFQVPFFVPVLISVALISVYTRRGGIKTVVWTDTLQTACLLSAALLSVVWILQRLDLPVSHLWSTVATSPHASIWVWDWQAPNHLVKHLLSGAFIAIVMTGLDQDMMQKNLTCRTASESQKNIYWFCVILVLANVLFLTLGVLLYHFGEAQGIVMLNGTTGGSLEIKDPGTGEWIARGTDELYPILAMDYLDSWVMLTFTLGLIAAAYSSADSALTALTTSFCVDFLKFELQSQLESDRRKTRERVQFGFATLIFVTIVVFERINDQAVIQSIFKVAGFTYGPLLGLYSFGLLTERSVRDSWVPTVCVMAPSLTYLADRFLPLWVDFEFGFLVLLMNGALTFFGLWFISRPRKPSDTGPWSAH